MPKTRADQLLERLGDLASVRHIGRDVTSYFSRGSIPVGIGHVDDPRFERQRDLCRQRACFDKQLRLECIRDVVELVEPDAGFAQTVVDRVIGQLPGRERDRALAMLDLRKALLFGGSDDRTVADEARGRIMEGRVDAERVQAGLPFVIAYSLVGGGNAPSMESCAATFVVSDRTAATTDSGATFARQRW